MSRAGRDSFNPRTGQRKVFHVTAEETNGEYCVIESWNQPHMPAEPYHRHPKLQTTFKILSGQLGFKIDGQESFGGPGDTMVVPANAKHHFWVHGDEVAHHMQEFRPAKKIDLLFQTLFGLARDGKLNKKGLPNILQLSVMMWFYKDEMRPAKPPWPILAPICAILTPIAWLLGYRSTYPEYHDLKADTTPEQQQKAIETIRQAT